MGSEVAAVIACTLLAAGAGAQNKPAPTHYEPTIESLNQHPVPQWYQDAKLGIFIHWGLYSVPGWATVEDAVYDFNDPEWARYNPYAEWYRNTMQVPGSPTMAYHRAHYGNADYYDFAKTFDEQTRKWDPDTWARLFTEAGAKYVVLTTKHHDGYTLWPSEIANPVLKGQKSHPSRDLVGGLNDALKKTDIRFGVYYSGGFDWTFKNGPFISTQERDAARVETAEYARYADAHYRELIRRYNPSILWNDISYPAKGDLLNIFAAFYNGRPDGVVDDRWGAFHHADISTPEYTSPSAIQPATWEECRGLADSFGYNRAETEIQTLTPVQLVHMLVDIVSKSGNLLLDVGPMADGAIPPLQAERLRQLGDWLRQNGDAIYGTRPWTRAEGRTEDGTAVRFTRKGNAVYAVLLSDPRERRITIPEMILPTVKGVTLLANGAALPFKQDGSFVRVTLPATLPGNYAYVLRIE